MIPRICSKKDNLNEQLHKKIECSFAAAAGVLNVK